MQLNEQTIGRRNFLKSSSVLAGGLAGITGLGLIPQFAFADRLPPDDSINIIGPKPGFSPQIGVMVSMMDWMRMVVLHSVKDLKQPDLDYLFDANSNTIGALLLHLAATESFYQANTFQEQDWDKIKDAFGQKWGVAMDLGEPARKAIKGHDLNYYTDTLHSVRESTLAEFRKRDDQWLMKVDPKFFDEKPTNNFCKWFHVCEHESNHNGQIKWLAKRLPGAKPGAE